MVVLEGHVVIPHPSADFNHLNIGQHVSVCESSWISNVLGRLGSLRFTHGICQGVQDVMRVTPWQDTLKPPKTQHNIRACLTGCCTLSHLIFVAFESPTEALGTLLHASRQALDCNSPGVPESDTKTIKDRSMRTKHKMTTFLGARKAQKKRWVEKLMIDFRARSGVGVATLTSVDCPWFDKSHQCLLHQGRFVRYCNPPKATESNAHPSRKLHKNHPESLKALNGLKLNANLQLSNG